MADSIPAERGVSNRVVFKCDLNEDACAHASFYAVNASRRLDWFVLSRSMLRAAGAWPIRWPRRKEAAVPLQQLAPKQSI